MEKERGKREWRVRKLEKNRKNVKKRLEWKELTHLHCVDVLV